MNIITGKASQFQKDAIVKAWKDMGESPEKLRSILHSLLQPGREPEYFTYQDPGLLGIRDAEFLQPVDSGEGRPRPLHLINLRTGNMVDSKDVGPLPAYCVLSHRWQGAEVTFAEFSEARKEALERVKDKGDDLAGNHMEIVLDHLKRRIENQYRKLKQLLAQTHVNSSIVAQKARLEALPRQTAIMSSMQPRACMILDVVIEASDGVVKEAEAKKRRKEEANKDENDENDEESDVQTVDETMKQAIEGLLVLMYHATTAKADYIQAQKNKTRLTTKYYVDKMETSLFNDVIEATVRKIDVRSTQTIERNTDTQTASGSEPPKAATSTKEDYKTSEIVEKSEKRYMRAVDVARQSRLRNADAWAYVDQLDRYLRDALEDLKRQLELRQSAIKLQNAMEEAKRLFATHLFPTDEDRYFWSDTCCINKDDSDEYSTSMSLMGDWYENASFCLVHLDRPAERPEKAASDWADFWKAERRFPGPAQTAATTDSRKRKTAVIPSFEAFLKERSTKAQKAWPDWITRGWTLQELVMSRLVFFSNATWTSLGRSIEGLGYMYPIVPFVGLYTSQFDRQLGGETKERALFNDHTIKTAFEILPQTTENNGDVFKVRNSDGIELRYNRQQAFDGDVQKAQRLAMILHVLGFSFPVDMSPETAGSAMAQAVHLAAMDLSEMSKSSGSGPAAATATATASDKSRRGVLEALKTDKADKADRADDGAESFAVERTLLNRLLYTLVACTKPQITQDRRDIASASGIEDLAAWSDGFKRTGFPAQQILALSCKRDFTKPTDRVYGLMGILGVQFSKFPAEGLARALARLLDAVVITTNDVSVFNWVGTNMRSPVHGRSMYPSSPEAYREDDSDDESDQDRATQYNRLMSHNVSKKQNEVMQTFGEIVEMLQATINAVDKNNRHALPLNVLTEIIIRVTSGSFDNLKPHIPSLHKIMLYIGSVLRTTSAAAKAAEKGQSGNKFMQAVRNRPSLSVPVPSSLMSKNKTKDAKNAVMDKAKKMGSLRLPGPSTGILGRKKTPEPVFDDAASTATTVVDVADKEADLAVPTAIAGGEGDWAWLASAVATGMDPLDKAETPPDLLDRIEQAADEEKKVAGGRGKDKDHDTTASRGKPNRKGLDDWALKGFISPNPIIVNNAGIESMFDIQRVIITMLDGDVLRRRVENAVHRNQVISGWCTISTGFSMVAVNFACEKHLLEAQLNVMSVVQDTIIHGENLGLWAGLQRLKGTKGDKGKGGEDVDGGNEQGNKEGQSEEDGREEVDDKDEDEEGKEGEEGGEKTEEEDGPDVKKDEEDIARVIQHLQEPNLTQVAGEWVLARFSGAAKADWFLCHLELGTTHQFYGHRIATSKIDFSTATIEPGMIGVWQTYMLRKKKKLCRILQHYMESGKYRKGAMESFGKSTDYAAKVGLRLAEETGVLLQVRQDTSRADSDISEAAIRLPPGDNEEQDEQAEPGGQPSESVLRQLLDDSGKALKQVGIFAFRNATSFLLKLHADHLNKHLTSAVLKKTPPELRAAVLNVDENRDMMPSMYHGARKVHMF